MTIEGLFRAVGDAAFAMACGVACVLALAGAATQLTTLGDAIAAGASMCDFIRSA